MKDDAEDYPVSYLSPCDCLPLPSRAASVEKSWSCQARVAALDDPVCKGSRRIFPG
jgi:hypothetical protein